MKCGEAGCVKEQDNLCCHSQCLGGCSKINSPFHCYACKNLRLPTGECVSKCPPELLEVNAAMTIMNSWNMKLLFHL